MDENLQAPLKKLSEALQRAISDSSEVEDALRILRTEGFAAHLVLEVTVAITRAADEDATADEDDDVEMDGDAADDEPVATDEIAPVADYSLPDTDFLRSLRIRLDD